MTSVDAERLRSELARACPGLWAEFSALVDDWTAPVLARLNRARTPPPFPKTFNDPVWGTIELFPWEVVLLDSPLLQRLRGVRQLGMAQKVYPAAGHTRLEHTLGVVEAAERMMQALKRNAQHRRRAGRDADEQIPDPSPLDERSARLAGLLHDVGHGPFSHATESLICDRNPREFEAAKAVLLRTFDGVTGVAPAETMAVLAVLSEPMRRVLEHPRLGAADEPAELPAAVAARLLGSRCCLHAGYLSGIVSGPLDADKLDYMARDSYHAGLPVALDLNRLINKLEVVTVTEEAPLPGLRRRAAAAPGRRLYEMGISLTGLGAYEQMIVGRVILYDRLYYHHKVRAAEAMLRKLVRVAEEERGRPFALRDLFLGVNDDGMVDVLSGYLTSPHFEGGGPRALALGRALQERRLYHRAYAFSGRFLGGLDGLPSEAQDETRILRWDALLQALGNAEESARLEQEIYEVADRALDAMPDLRPEGAELRPEHVLVDLAINKVAVHGGDLLTRTEDGHLSMPNLFFDAEKWSAAYKEQKQAGYVFAPREFVPVVALASRLVFCERFQLVMGREADRAAKTAGLVPPELVRRAAALGLCSPECAAALAGA